MRFTIHSNYKQMVDAARSLGVKWFQVTKVDLVAALNKKLDEIDVQLNTIELNLIEAADALTETELTILTTLLEKVDDYKEARHTEEAMAKIAALFGDRLWGPPGINKPELGSYKLPDGVKIIPLVGNFEDFLNKYRIF